MKKKIQLLGVLLLCLVSMPGWGVTINKAKPVAKKQTTTTDSATSLIPTVLGIVSTVQQLNAKQTALTADCVPSAQEIRFVNEMVQEWAKIGSSNASTAIAALGMARCDTSDGYAARIKAYAGTDETAYMCVDWFNEPAAVWYQYPKATVVSYCEDGSTSCKNKKTASNIYNIFALVDFNEKDLVGSEISMANKLKEKLEKCSDAKINAQKREMWGSFLIDTVGNLGQGTNTGAIMQQVQSGVSSGGGGIGSLGSLGDMIGNFMQ